MKVGDLVLCSIYPDKEQGKIINTITLDKINYYEVYFPKTKEVLSIEEKDIQQIISPLDKIKKGAFDNTLLFKMRILAEKLDSLLYQDKLIAANNFKIVPLPHQVLAVNYVFEQFLPRCLMADEVGLGKTIEAALIFEEMKLRNIVKRILIVTPAGLTPQWKDELKTKFNEDFIVIDRNTFTALKEINGNINIWKKYNYVITSLDFLKPTSIKDSLSDKQKKKREEHNQQVTEDCANAHWDMVIFDEAHKLSKDSEGAETSRYKLGLKLAESAPILLLLTATPHQGDSEKFRHLLCLIDPYKFYSKESLTPDNVKSVTIKNKKRSAVDFKGNLIFKSRVTSLVKIDRDPKDIEVQLYNEVSEYVSKYYNLAAREGNFVFMFLLILYQRMVSSSSRAIYESLNNRLNFLYNLQVQASKILNEDMDFEELEDLEAQEVYDAITHQEEVSNQPKAIITADKAKIVAIPQLIKDEIEILKRCVDFAKKASFGRQDYKVRKVLEILSEVTKRENDPKAKALIFTEFISTQKYLGEILEKMGYTVAYLNGRMSLDEKIEAKTKFKNESQILVSTDAGGEGINLQFCHVVINYDLPWNPMKIEQRIGRLDRIGQKKDVMVFNFVVKNTVEERVRDILEEKLERIAKQFGEDKTTDVLNFLQDEFNFDRIFIDAIREKQKELPELQKIGEQVFNRAKEILENQEFLLPFTENQDNKKLQNSMIENESQVILELVKDYAHYQNTELIEYSKKKGVFYTEKNIGDYKLKNVVFEKDMAIEDESLDLLNITHPLVKESVNEIMKKESLAFNLEIEGCGKSDKGMLLFYRIDLTNNEGFLKRFLFPIYIDGTNTYDEKISKIFDSIEKYKIKTGINNGIKINDTVLQVADKILNIRLKQVYASTKVELVKKVEQEQQKFNKYFEDKEKAITKIAIQNIREAKQRELYQQKVNEKVTLEKKKNLVPTLKLFAIAQIELKK